MQNASNTLADLTAQVQRGAYTSGTCATHAQIPCITDAGLNDIFNGAELVMTPFPPTPLSTTTNTVMNATISEVIFDNVSTSNSGCCRARVVWSVGFGPSPTLRACGLLTSVANGTNGPTSMPIGNYPGGVGDAITNGTYFVPPVKNTDYYLIVADVTYQFKPTPGYDFRLFNWGNDANGGQGYTITQTTYMTPRGGASLQFPNPPDNGAPQQNEAIYWSPDGTIPTANYHNCPCVTGGSTSCTAGTANPSASSGIYYTP